MAFRLLEEGADLYVCDLNEAAVEEVVAYGKQIGALVKPVNGTEIYRVNADVFVPCAFGGVINDETAASLRVKAVVGSANNQLVDKRHARMLKERGIVYAPDYIVNAGGLIQVADELYGANKERVLAKTKAIYDTLLAIYTRAESEGITTMDAADQFCEERLEKRKQRNHFFAHQKRPKWDIRR